MGSLISTTTKTAFSAFISMVSFNTDHNQKTSLSHTTDDKDNDHISAALSQYPHDQELFWSKIVSKISATKSISVASSSPSLCSSYNSEAFISHSRVSDGSMESVTIKFSQSTCSRCAYNKPYYQPSSFYATCSSTHTTTTIFTLYKYSHSTRV